MTEFYTIFARKITKFLNFTSHLPEKYFSKILGNMPLPRCPSLLRCDTNKKLPLPSTFYYLSIRLLIYQAFPPSTFYY